MNNLTKALLPIEKFLLKMKMILINATLILLKKYSMKSGEEKIVWLFVTI